MRRISPILIGLSLVLASDQAIAGTDPAKPVPTAAVPANEPLRHDVPLLIFDVRSASRLQQYVGHPSASLVDAFNDLAGGKCVDLRTYPDATTLSENDRRFDSASLGIQIAIRYDWEATAPPTYSFTLTNLNPRVEAQLGALEFPFDASCEHPDSKVVTRYYGSTSAWADITGTIDVMGGKISTDLVLGPEYHLMLPGSIAVNSVNEVKYNSTTNKLETRDTPKSGYIGLGYSSSDVYKLGIVGQVLVSLSSKPLNSVGVAVGMHAPHLRLGPIRLEQIGLYVGYIWTRNDTAANAANTQSRMVGKSRILLGYDLAALVKVLKGNTSATSSGAVKNKNSL